MWQDILPDRYQGRLEAEGIFLRARVLGELCRNVGPVPENADSILVDEPIGLADTGEVDLADEVDDGRLLGVFVAAVHLELVDSVLVISLVREQQLATETHGCGRYGLAEVGLGVHEAVPRLSLASWS